MAEEDDESSAWATADSWKSGAIALAIITPVVAAFALPWAFRVETDEAMLQRVQMIGAGVAFGLALVTFCTVVWRGMISAEQAKLQRLQVEKLSEQIRASEENTLIEQLQRGAEMLDDEAKTSHVMAGIASLHAVASARNARFAVAAMDLLADFVDGEPLGEPRLIGKAAVAAIDAMRDVSASRGITSTRKLHIRGSEFTGNAPLIVGPSDVVYTNLQFNFVYISSAEITPTKMRFVGCIFKECIVDLSAAVYRNCAFDECQITNYGIARRRPFRFVDCDFSDCFVEEPGMFPDLRSGGNFFMPGRPPVTFGDYTQVRWENYLLPGPT